MSLYSYRWPKKKKKKSTNIQDERKENFIWAKLKTATWETESQKLWELLCWSGIRQHICAFLRQRNYVSYWQVSIVYIVHQRFFFQLCMYRQVFGECNPLYEMKKNILIIELQCWCLKKEANFFSKVNFISLLWGLVNV